MHNLVYTFFGLFFGVIITKSDVISWFRIQAMFRFEEAHMYLTIGSAVVTGAIAIFLLKKLEIKSFNSQILNLKGKPYTRGFIYGGFIFGIGWAITGACPGPIFAQIGAGEFPAIVTLLGAVLGAQFYHLVKARLPH